MSIIDKLEPILEKENKISERAEALKDKNGEIVSNCCNANFEENTWDGEHGVCSKCKEMASRETFDEDEKIEEAVAPEFIAKLNELVNDAVEWGKYANSVSGEELEGTEAQEIGSLLVDIWNASMTGNPKDTTYEGEIFK